MRILFIAPSLPINNGSGGSIRSFQMYSYLKSMGNVDVVTCSWQSDIDKETFANFPDKDKYLGNVHNVPFIALMHDRNPKAGEALRKLVDPNNYDLIFVRYFISAHGLKLLKQPNLYLDCDDYDVESMKAYAKAPNAPWFFRLYCLATALKLKYLIAHALRPVAKVFFSRKPATLKWEANYNVIPNKINFIDLPKEAEHIESDQVLFIGVLNYLPNFSGLDHFITYVWPEVLNKKPSAQLKIVGALLPNDLAEKWNKVGNITLCGYVDDIEEVYKDTAITIVPVYGGSGTHIKILESLMRKKPSVITPEAHRGYESILHDGDALYVARNDSEYAEKIVALLSSQTLMRTMGDRGRTLVTEHFSIQHGVNLISSIV